MDPKVLDSAAVSLEERNEAKAAYKMLHKKLESDLWFKFRIATNLVKSTDVNPYRLAAAVGEASAVMEMLDSLKRKME